MIMGGRVYPLIARAMFFLGHHVETYQVKLDHQLSCSCFFFERNQESHYNNPLDFDPLQLWFNFLDSKICGSISWGMSILVKDLY